MEKYFGFDLGDAESCVSRLNDVHEQTPEVLPITDKKSFITAYAMMPDGSLRIGENACYETGAVKRKLRFKSLFLKDRSCEKDIKSFAQGVLGELFENDYLSYNDPANFYIGCPAGWSKNDRERYRAIFEAAGYPPVKIISESRAALVSACQSRHLQVGYDILAKPVLVVDIGSSTTDFAYVCQGKEMDIRTAGEVYLGGGIMDEILLEESINDSVGKDKIRQVFKESEAWKNYCEFAARRLKEKYYSDEDYFSENVCSESVMIHFDKPLRLRLIMNKQRAETLVNKPVERLDGKSFKEVFIQSLNNVKETITGSKPELIFLTGGVSKLPAIRDWCAEVFSEAVIICGAEPEFSVSRGLTWCGRIDDELKAFKLELEDLKRSSVVEEIVRDNIEDLYRLAVDALVEPILKEVAAPVYSRWRKGEIRILEDMDQEMQRAIESFLHSDEAKELLIHPITEWLRPISDSLEEHTMPICIRHRVPYSAMSLKSYLEASDIDIQIDSKNLFGIEEITWLIDSLVSILIGLLCGGSGIALIASGIPGIVIGFMISFLVLALGKKQMEKALLNMDLPTPLRKLAPKDLFDKRLDSISYKIKENLFESLENEKNEGITSRMVDEISLQIEQCLSKMAEVVEIPLSSC